MRDLGDRQRPVWPIDTRLSASDLFDMIETAERDPTALGPEVLAALRDDPYGRHALAQIDATEKVKPRRRGR